MSGPALVTIDLNDSNAAKGLANFVADYTRQVDGAKKSTDGWKFSLTELNQAAELGKKIVGGLFAVISTGVGIVKNAVLATASYDMAITALAKTTGSTTTQIQSLTLAANRFGIETQDIQQGLKGLSAKMFEARDSGSEAGQMFGALGVRVKNFDGSLRSTVDVFRELSDKFKAMPDGATKTALSMRLMEESGLKLVGFMSQGSKAIDETAERLKKLNLVADEASVKLGVDLGKALNWTATMMDAVYQKLGGLLIPGVLEATKAFNEFVEDSLEKADWGAVKNGIADVVAALREIVPVVTAASQALLTLLDKLQRLKSYALVGGATVANKAQDFREYVFGKMIGSGILGGTEEERAKALATLARKKAERGAGLNEFAASEFEAMDRVTTGIGAASSGVGAAGQGVYSLGQAAERGIRQGGVGGTGTAGPSAANNFGVEVFRGPGGGSGGLGSMGGGGGAGMAGLVGGGGPKMIEATASVAQLSNAVQGLGSAAASATPEVLKGAGAMRANFDGLMYHSSGEAPRLPSVSWDPDTHRGIRSSDGGMARSLTAWGNGPTMPSRDYTKEAHDKSSAAFDAMNAGFSGFGGVRLAGTFSAADKAFEQVGGGTPGFGGAPGTLGRMMYGYGSVFEGEAYNRWNQGGYEQYQANQQRGAQMRDAWNTRQQGITSAARQQQADQAAASDAYQASRREAQSTYNQSQSDIYQASELRRMYGDKIPNDVMGKVPDGVREILSGGKQIGDMFALVGKSAQALSTALVSAQKALQSANFAASKNMQDTLNRMKKDGAIS